MNKYKRLYALTTATAVIIASPLHAQFGGLGTLKKVLEAATKPQAQPKQQPAPTSAPPVPQPMAMPQPVAAPQPERVSAPPVNSARQSDATPVPISSSASATQVAVNEIWRCRGESDATPIKLEFNYRQSPSGQRLGTFTETATFEFEGKETAPPSIEKGVFRFAGATYKLDYNNPEMRNVDLVVSNEDPENGWVPSSSRYDFTSMKSIETITEVVPQYIIDNSEEFGGDTNALTCNIVKPIYSKYSFEEFYVARPTEFYDEYREDPKLPQFSARDVKYRQVRTMLTEAVENHYNYNKFAKYQIVVEGGKHLGLYAYLIDMRSGKVSDLFMESIDGGLVVDYLYYKNSNLVISVTADFDADYCNLVYSKWNGIALETVDREKIGDYQFCLNEYGTEVREGYLQRLEDVRLR